MSTPIRGVLNSLVLDEMDFIWAIGYVYEYRIFSKLHSTRRMTGGSGMTTGECDGDFFADRLGTFIAFWGDSGGLLLSIPSKPTDGNEENV